MAESDIVGTLWKVIRTQGTTLWMRVARSVVAVLWSEGKLFPGDVLVVMEEDDFGNIRILTRYGVFWTTYQNMKRAAEKQ